MDMRQINFFKLSVKSPNLSQKSESKQQPKPQHDIEALGRFRAFLEQQQLGTAAQQQKAVQRIRYNQQELSRSYEISQQYRNRESIQSENKIYDFNSKLSSDNIIDQQIDEPTADIILETIEEALEIEKQCRNNIAVEQERLAVLNTIKDVNSELIKKIGEQL